MAFQIVKRTIRCAFKIRNVFKEEWRPSMAVQIVRRTAWCTAPIHLYSFNRNHQHTLCVQIYIWLVPGRSSSTLRFSTIWAIDNKFQISVYIG